MFNEQSEYEVRSSIGRMARRVRRLCAPRDPDRNPDL